MVVCTMLFSAVISAVGLSHHLLGHELRPLEPLPLCHLQCPLSDGCERIYQRRGELTYAKTICDKKYGNMNINLNLRPYIF